MYKALIVGAGGMGKAWGRSLKEFNKVQIAGWVDVRAGAAEAAAAELQIPYLYTGGDLGKAIKDVKPDFVVDVTIPEAHHDVTLQALAAGIPVLGEKPMAATMEQARAMVAASESAGKLYMVSQSRRYNGRLRQFRELIQNHVGLPLGILNSDFYMGVHFGGFRDEMPSPLLLDMAIHTFDAARYLSGADAVAVYCEEFNPPGSWYAGNAAATAIFEMSNGLRYTYSGSWCSEGRKTSWEGEWRASGAAGTATWDGTNAPVAEIAAGDANFERTMEERRPADLGTATYDGISGSMRDFVNALETGATPMGECHDNIKSLAMVFAAIESAQTGRRVPVVAL